MNAARFSPSSVASMIVLRRHSLWIVEKSAEDSMGAVKAKFSSTNICDHF
jgi:hypothetical protein